MGSVPHFNIGIPITHHEGTCLVYPISFYKIIQHAGHWFSAAAASTWFMDAVTGIADHTASGTDELEHVFINLSQR